MSEWFRKLRAGFCIRIAGRDPDEVIKMEDINSDLEK